MEEGGRERESKEAKGGGDGDSGNQPLGEWAVRAIFLRHTMVTWSLVPLRPLPHTHPPPPPSLLHLARPRYHFTPPTTTHSTDMQ